MDLQQNRRSVVYTHILISTDGSALAQRGVDHGLSLASALGSKVTMITVTEPLPVLAISDGAWPVDLKGYEADQTKFAESVLSAVKASAAKMRLEVNTAHVPNSHPASAIVETAKKLGCNLIVMASHGRRGIKKVLLGSQTAEVLVTATVPVLVVH
jgi:nucleotide-binding universal stress UspA family protein